MDALQPSAPKFVQKQFMWSAAAEENKLTSVDDSFFFL